MPFLTIAELHTIRTADFIAILKGTDETVIDEIIDENISVFKTFLGSYYDMNAVFTAVDNTRNKTVLKYLKKLIVFELMERRKPGGDDKDYQEVMKWLEDISSGKLSVDLPPKLIDLDGDGIEDDPTPFMKLGGRKSYGNHW